MKLKRVGAPAPSPDGKWVVFDCVDVDLEANTRISHLWIVPASGGESRRLNQTRITRTATFFTRRQRLIWTSKATDPTQIWICDFDSNAGALTGKPHQVTDISTGADGESGHRRQEHRIRVGGISGLQRRRMQQATRRRAEEEQGESENLFAIVLPPLERVHRIQTQPSVCAECRAPVPGAGNGMRPARPHKRSYAGRSMCRRSR